MEDSNFLAKLVAFTVSKENTVTQICLKNSNDDADNSVTCIVARVQLAVERMEYRTSNDHLLLYEPSGAGETSKTVYRHKFVTLNNSTTLLVFDRLKGVLGIKIINTKSSAKGGTGLRNSERSNLIFTQGSNCEVASKNQMAFGSDMFKIVMNDERVIYVNATEVRENLNNKKFSKPNYFLPQQQQQQQRDPQSNLAIRIWCSHHKIHSIDVELHIKKESLAEAARRVKNILDQYRKQFKTSGEQESNTKPFEFSNFFQEFPVKFKDKLLKWLKNIIFQPSDDNLTEKQKAERDIYCMCNKIDDNFEIRILTLKPGTFLIIAFVGILIFVIICFCCQPKVKEKAIKFGTKAMIKSEKFKSSASKKLGSPVKKLKSVWNRNRSEKELAQKISDPEEYVYEYDSNIINDE